MTPGYPAMLRLVGRPCVVVGGGAVATRKLQALVRAGADVLVVAPDVSEAVERLEGRGAIRVERRAFEPGDLDRVFLTIAATDRRDVNASVMRAARERGVLVNVADDPSACDFLVPAIVRRGDVTLAVSTGGRSPAFARYLREQLDDWLTDARCAVLEILTEVRRDLRAAGKPMNGEVWREAVKDEGLAAAISTGDREGARRRLFTALMGRS